MLIKIFNGIVIGFLVLQLMAMAVVMCEPSVKLVQPIKIHITEKNA